MRSDVRGSLLSIAGVALAGAYIIRGGPGVVDYVLPDARAMTLPAVGSTERRLARLVDDLERELGS